MTEGMRKGSGCEGKGRDEGCLLHEEGGELEQEVGVLIADECDIVEKVALRRNRW